MKSIILVTGGTGYIGSHIVVELLQQNYSVIMIDNFVNSNEDTIEAIYKITGKKPKLYVCDLNEVAILSDIIVKEHIDCVVHCAALKSISDSYTKTLEYYHNNVTGTINLLLAMKQSNVKKIVFSSTAALYKDTNIAVTEEDEIEITNPYSRTKSMIEEILGDLYQNDPEWSISILRFFNPIGAHPSGLIGENSKIIPDNILPLITDVAIGKRPCFDIFGDDYDTKDGTGVRDYVHVVDIAKCHVRVIEYIKENQHIFEVFNVGTGIGYSVKELIEVFEKTNRLKVPTKVVKRRLGDVGTSYANCNKIHTMLHWKAEFTLGDMCRDTWVWVKKLESMK